MEGRKEGRKWGNRDERLGDGGKEKGRRSSAGSAESSQQIELHQ